MSSKDDGLYFAQVHFEDPKPSDRKASRKDAHLKPLCDEFDSKSSGDGQRLIVVVQKLRKARAQEWTACDAANQYMEKLKGVVSDAQVFFDLLEGHITALEKYAQACRETAKLGQDLHELEKKIGFTDNCKGLIEKKIQYGARMINNAKQEIANAKYNIDRMRQKLSAGSSRKTLDAKGVGQRRQQEADEYYILQHPFEYGTIKFLGDCKPCKFLGAGGMGAVALWVQVDETDTIVRRVVRKDTRFSPHAMTDATSWVGDPKALSGRVPMEWHCHRRVSGQPEAKSVVKVLKYEFSRRQFRLYMDYCPHGDLQDIIEKYAAEKRAIPEPWIWLVFSALVDCGLIMERGGIKEKPHKWQQIVHRDLKPPNIFLDLPLHDSWPRYPQPKLADFGLAFETSPDDELNPLIWNNGAGTPGFYPPEQRSYIDRITLEPVDAFKLLAHTNVWGVGATILYLMDKEAVSPKNQPNYCPGGRFTYELKAWLKDHYSEVLMSTVRDCLAFDPAKRPSFQKIRDLMDRIFVEDLPKEDRFYDMSHYIREARRGKQQPNSAYDLDHVLEDKYKVGLAYEGPRDSD